MQRINGLLGTQQCNAAAWNNAFFNSCTGCVATTPLSAAER
jgi:hypothetical protein